MNNQRNNDRKAWSKRLLQATLSFPCELCHARPGEPCMTSSGNGVIAEHSMRRRQGRHKIDVEDGVYTKKEFQ